MENTNLENLNRLAKLFGTDRLISPEDIQEIRSILIGVLANNKKEVESLTEETKQAVESFLNKVETEHDKYLDETKQIAQELKSDTTEAINFTLKSLEEVKALCKEVMDSKPENGEDADEEYVIGEVLNRIKLPEYKEIVLDDGGAIVDKINSLPVNEENQIDAKHIKNLPEVKGGRVISGGVTRKIVEQMIEAAGGGTGDVTGPASAVDGQAAVYDGTTGKIIKTFVPTAGSVLFAGTSGILQQDNSNLFWDDTNNRLGIGTASPLTKLHLSGGDVSTGFTTATIALGFNTTGQYPHFIHTRHNGGPTSNAIDFYTSDGTAAGVYPTNAIHGMTISNTQIGLQTTSPTHTLTLASTGTGIALYNTADQTTNYERARMYWSGNELILNTENAGTGSSRFIRVGGVLLGAGFIRSSSGLVAGQYIDANYSQSFVRMYATRAESSGTGYNLVINPNISQTSTAGYTALLVNPTETTTGSGTKLLADFQVGGTTKAAISNTGYLGIGAVATYPIDIQLALAQQQIKSTTGTNYVITRYNNTGGDFYVGRESSTGGAVLAGTTAYSAVLASGGAYSMHFGTNNTIGLTISSAQVVTIPNNSIITANAITATANAATIPVTKGRNIVTNNSAATLTITLTTSGAVNMQTVIVQILDFSAAAQTLTFVNTENSTVSVPATTNGSTTLPLTVGFIYNAATSKWRCIASA